MSTLTHKPFNTQVQDVEEARRTIQQLDSTFGKLAGDASTALTAAEGDITTNTTNIATNTTNIANITSGTTVTAVSAADKASLPASSNGIMGFTTGATTRGYMRVGGAWLCTTHFES